jgi:type IV secretion system protein VirB3
MKFGVPLVPLVLLGSGSFLLIFWGGLLVSWWTLLPVLCASGPGLFWMRFITRKDDQRFKQLFLAGRLRLSDRNHRLWASRSYCPYTHRGATDAWRR